MSHPPQFRQARTSAFVRRWSPLLVAIAGPALALLIGTDLPHALLIGGTLAAATLVVRALPFGSRAAWPVLPYGRRDGARRDVSSLTWTMIDRGGAISSTGERRLRTVLSDALELRGLDLTTPRGREQAETVVGADVARWLTDPEAHAPDPRAVRRIIARVQHADQPTRTKGTP